MNYNRSSNLNDGPLPGVDALRRDPVNASGVSIAAARMLAEGSPRTRSRKVTYLAFVAAAAAFAGVALLPRSSSAASLQTVDVAIDRQSARYERVYKPDEHGQLKLYLEAWGEPGKYAYRFVDGNEFRQNGKVNYSYWTKNNVQRVEPGRAEEVDPVGVGAYAQFKLVKTERAGAEIRYVFSINQDLYVDPKTTLPTRRVVYNPDGSLIEVHEYHFQKLDDRVFDPDIKPGVPLFDTEADREKVRQALAAVPAMREVGGVNVSLHAVIVDSTGGVGAVVTGDGLIPSSPKNALQVVGLPAGFGLVGPGYHPFHVKGQPAQLVKVFFPDKPRIPDSFTIRVPAWEAGKLVGYASFEVHAPIRVESVEKVLPNYEDPLAGTGATVTTAEATQRKP